MHLLQTPTVESIDAAAQRFVRAHASSTTPSRRATRLQFFVGTCFHHLVRERRRAAHDAQARQPAQLRRRAARGAALHLNAPMHATVYDAFAAIAARTRRRRVPVHRVGHRRGLRHRRRRAQLGRGRRRGRAPARRLRAGRLRPRPPRRPAAREPAGLLLPLVRAQRAGRQRGADQCRDALGRTDLPDRPQRDRPGGDAAATREGDLRAAAAEAGIDLRHDAGPRSRAASRRRARRRAAAGEPIGRDTECALLYTSGTTGRPKGCMPRQRLLPARRRVVLRRSASVCRASRPTPSASSRRCRSTT